MRQKCAGRFPAFKSVKGVRAQFKKKCDLEDKAFDDYFKHMESCFKETGGLADKAEYKKYLSDRKADAKKADMDKDEASVTCGEKVMGIKK